MFSLSLLEKREAMLEMQQLGLGTGSLLKVISTLRLNTADLNMMLAEISALTGIGTSFVLMFILSLIHGFKLSWIRFPRRS
jgi:hypothetical protein